MEEVYNFVAGFECIFIFFIFATYLFLEPTFTRRKQWYWFAGSYLFSYCVVYFILRGYSDLFILLPIFYCAVYLVCVRKKKKICGFFRVIPIFGAAIGVYELGNICYYTCVGKMPNVYVFDIVLFGAVLIFWWKGKKFRQRFHVDYAHRTVEKWEHNLLNGVGMFF